MNSSYLPLLIRVLIAALTVQSRRTAIAKHIIKRKENIAMKELSKQFIGNHSRAGEHHAKSMLLPCFFDALSSPPQRENPLWAFSRF